MFQNNNILLYIFYIRRYFSYQKIKLYKIKMIKYTLTN